MVFSSSSASWIASWSVSSAVAAIDDGAAEVVWESVGTLGVLASADAVEGPLVPPPNSP